MKQKILIVISFIAFISFQCQSQIEGRFCDSKIDSNVCIDLTKDGKFEYTSGGHIPPDVHGVGTYEVHNDTIILNYHKQSNATYNLSRYQVSKSVPNDSLVNFEFQITDFNKKPLNGINILFSESDIFEKGIIVEDGEALLEFSKTRKEIILRVSDLRYLPQEIKLSRDYSYKINIQLASIGQKLPIEEGKEFLLVKKSLGGEKVLIKRDKPIFNNSKPIELFKIK